METPLPTPGPDPGPIVQDVTLRRRVLSWINLVLLSLFVLGFLVMANVFANTWYRRFDMTADKIWQVSDHSERVIKGLRREVDVYLTPFVAGPFAQDRSLPEAWRQTERLLNELAALNPKLRVSMIQEGSAAASRFQAEFTSGQTANGIHFATRTAEGTPARKVLPIYELFTGNSQTGELMDYRGEGKVIATIVNLVSDRVKTVYATTGHREFPATDTSHMGMSVLVDLLAQMDNVQFKPLNLRQEGIPAGCDILFVFGPAADFDPAELEVMRQYRAKGGRFLVALNPFIGDPLKGLRDFLEEGGLRPNRDLVLDPQSEAQHLFAHRILNFGPHPINLGAPPWVIIRETGSVEGAPRSPRMKAQPLLITKPTAWGETKFGKEDLEKGPRQDFGEPTEVAVAAAVEEDVGAPRKTRTVVWGGILAFLNQFAARDPQTLEYLANSFRWLLEHEVAAPGKGKKFTIRPPALTSGAKAVIGWISIAALPLLGVALGLLAWFFRRK